MVPGRAEESSENSGDVHQQKLNPLLCTLQNCLNMHFALL